MIKRLQDISFRVSRYFRPLDTWHCGGREDGSNCILGPDNAGNCRAIQDCAPAQVDKTWECTRSQLLGGNCKAGPSSHGACGRKTPPCQPVRSIRSQRSRFGWMVASIALALTVLAVVVDNWQLNTNAGELSKYHSAFGEQKCVACHSAAESPRESWLQSAFGYDHTELEHGDNQKCTSCHVLGEESLAVHSMPKESLNLLTVASEERLKKSSDRNGTSILLSAGKVIRGDDNDAPACSICHQEHMGSDADIAAISDQQCAVCHTNTFDKFENHPTFSAYPSERRTPIIFSHNTHLNKHFSEDDLQDLAPQACADCHEIDLIGRKMEIKGFDSTCSVCHLTQVTGESRAGEKGFAMLSIPGVDLDTLNQRGVLIGEWPEFSDAEFTPLNYLLVAATAPDLAERLDLFDELDLFDLSEASDEQLHLVFDVLWTLKQVFFEMQRGGARVVTQKLSSVMPDNSVNNGEIFGLLSPAVVDNAIGNSFPNLEAEMLRWLQKSEPIFKLTQPKEALASPLASQANVATDDADDDWLNGAIEENGDDDWLSGALDEDEDILDEDEDINDVEASQKLEAQSEDDWLSGALDEDDSGEDEWLSESLDDNAKDGDDWLNDALGDESSVLDDDDFSVDSSDQVRMIENNVEVIEKASLEDRAAAGGWYYDGHYLRYRPSGHADRLIVAWIEKLSVINWSAFASPSFGQKMQSALFGDNTPGSCLKCHSVDDADSKSGLAKVNWFGLKTLPSNHDFNAFKHQSHFSVIEKSENDFAQGQITGCLSCHKINAESDSSAAYESGVSTFQSDFHDLEANQCAECHADEPALASCTQCHNYHIGDRGLTEIGE